MSAHEKMDKCIVVHSDNVIVPSKDKEWTIGMCAEHGGITYTLCRVEDSRFHLHEVQEQAKLMGDDRNQNSGYFWGALTEKGHENLQDSGNVPYLDLLVIQEQTCKHSPHHVLHKVYCMNVISQLQKKEKISLSNACGYGEDK